MNTLLDGELLNSVQFLLEMAQGVRHTSPAILPQDSDIQGGLMNTGFKVAFALLALFAASTVRAQVDFCQEVTPILDFMSECTASEN